MTRDADHLAAVRGARHAHRPRRPADRAARGHAARGRGLVRAFAALVTARRLNDQAYALVRQGRLAVYPSSHGQEACQVAAAQVLADDDWLFPTYRDTVAAVGRGVDPVEVLTLLKGDWHCGYDPYEHQVAPAVHPARHPAAARRRRRARRAAARARTPW